MNDFFNTQAQFAFMVTGTKVGKTLGSALWLVKNAWEKPREKYWWIAPVYPQTKIGFRLMQGMVPRDLCRVNKTELSITFPNHTVIECKSGKEPDNLFGEGINKVVFDEASRAVEESFNAIRTTVSATQGEVKLIANPRGRNWFYKYHLMGQDALKPNYASFSMSTYDSPYVDKSVLDDAKSVLPENVFRELYLGEFIEDNTGVFRGVSKCISNTFAKPQYGHNYVIGVDLAKHQDFTVLCVMDRANNSVVAFDRFNQIDWRIQKDRIVQLAKRYNDAYVMMDSTGIGDPIYDDLRRLIPHLKGYKFTNESKRVLIEGLMVAIEQQKIRYPHIPELIGELEAYEYQMTRTGNISYNAPVGINDDTVIALALAQYANNINPAIMENIEGRKKKFDSLY